MDIKYLMGLTPAKRLSAGMLLMIAFLSSGWFNTDRNFTNYRNRKEDQIIRIISEKDQKLIDVYTRYIDIQGKRSDTMEAKIKEANDAMKEILKILNTK